MSPSFKLFLFLLLILSNHLFADSIPASYDRIQVMQILNERKEQFSTYTQSLDDASGIFGNKTKKDIKKSQKILVEIVRLDNRLIDVLNRRVDYKGFQTIDLNYKQLDAEKKVNDMRDAMQLSDKRIAMQDQQLKAQRMKIRSLTISIVFVIILFVSILIFLYRKLKRKVAFLK